MTTGTYGKGTGLVVLTDRRLLFVQDGVMSKTTEDFPMEKVSSVEWTSGMMLGSIVIFASGNKSEIKNVNKDDGKGELRDAGVVTAEEFEAKKAELLGRLWRAGGGV